VGQWRESPKICSKWISAWEPLAHLMSGARRGDRMFNSLRKEMEVIRILTEKFDEMFKKEKEKTD
jgi:hypothetical protein